MTGPSLICSLVGSSRGAREFRLLHASARRWGTWRFLVACPPGCAEPLSALADVTILPIIDPALPYGDGEGRDYYSDRCRRILRHKIDLCRAALRLGEPALYMDADSIVVGPLEDPLSEWLTGYDILATPHYFAPHMAAEVGRCNAGMFFTASGAFLDAWESGMAQEARGFGDQTSFNRALARFGARDLPMRFNIGWWRCWPEATPVRPIYFREGRFWVGDEPVFNFHLRLGAGTELQRRISAMLTGPDAHSELFQALSASR